MNRKILAGSLAAIMMVAVAGCGEAEKVTVFKQGTYQGKKDVPPWDSADFKGDKSAWENAINTRTLGQNEYVRITGGG